MKTVKNIKAELDETFRLMEYQKKHSKAEKPNGNTLNKYKRLKVCLAYVQGNPSEEYVKSERDRVIKLMEAVFKRYQPLDPERFPKKECRDYLKQFEKDFNVPNLRAQLTALTFILN